MERVNTDYSNLTLEEGKALWLEKKGIVHTLVAYHPVARGHIIEGPYWGAKWVATNGVGNQGKLIITPRCKEARDFVRGEVVKGLQEKYSIDEALALRVYRAPIEFRYEILDTVMIMLEDKAAVEAAGHFPGIGPRSHIPWLERWGNVVEDYLVYSWPRNQAVLDAVKHIGCDSLG
jgi:hypothetical protein